MEEKEYIEQLQNTELRDVDLELKHINTEWHDEYGLLKGILYINGNRTKNQLIFKNGNFVANVGSYHNIYPNELAEGLADTVAESLGYKEHKTMETDAKMTKIYMSGDKVEINGEDVHRGFTVANSIDGTRSLRVEGYTFREICSNGVIMGKNQLVSVSRRHTPEFSVNPEKVRENVELMMEDVQEVLESYEVMAQKQLNEQMAERLAKSNLPRKVFPRYIEVERDELLSFDNTVSEWQVYNDLTEEIWHNDKTNLDSKRRYYDRVHSAMSIPRTQ